MIKGSLKKGLFCLTILCSAGIASAQAPFDSTTFDSSRLGIEGATSIDGTYAPESDNSLMNEAKPAPKRWQALCNAHAYDYRNKLEYAPKETEPEKESNLEKFLNQVFNFLDSVTGKNMLWLLLFIILGYIVWRVISGQANSLFVRREKRHFSSENPEELNIESLLERDWKVQMEVALQSGDKRAAIRFAYLHLLQLMQHQGLISFSPDKTNQTYLSELKDWPQATEFRSLTRQYEWTWYGRYLPDEKQMAAFLENFQHIRQSIGAT